MRPEFAVDALEPRTLFAVAAGFKEEVFVNSLDRPTAMAFAPDGRLFVCEQDGDLRVVKDGALLPTPFLSAPVDPSGERGLLGIAFDPEFELNSHVYVYYTVPDPGVHNRVSRFTASGDVAVPDSEQVLLDLPGLSTANNHNGGAIHFGPDGKLYVAVGENANPALSQSLETPLGKILRLNRDGTIPGDNPFIESTTGQNQAIWALGLRNPYTFAFDPATGRMHINDVGQGTFEEINIGQAGANYGWPDIEGTRRRQTAPENYADPFFAYGRTGRGVVGNCIAGGAFYRADPAADSAFADSFQGDYFFADFGAGFVKSIDLNSRRVTDIASAMQAPVDLKVGADGRVYVLEFGGRVTALSPQLANFVTTLESEPAQSVIQGDKEKVLVRVTNASSVTAAGTVTIRLLASTDDVADGDDVVLAETTRRLKLRPERGKTFAFRFRYPESIAGDVRILAQAVVDKSVKETTTDDNLALSQGLVTVAAAFVNLSPVLLEEPRVPLVAGRSASFVLGLSNIGNVTVSSRVGLRVIASDDGAVDAGDTILRTTALRVKISAGGTKAIRLKFVVPGALAGRSVQLLADVDAANAIVESDELDNLLTLPNPFSVQ